MSNIGSGKGTSWFSEQDWDHIFNNLPQADWDSNTNTHSAAVEQLDIDLDATEWSSWDDLIIGRINGCSVNNISLSADLQAIGKYLMDAELQDDNNNIEEDLISSHRRDAIFSQCPINNSNPVVIGHPALIDGDHLVSDSAVTDQAKATNSSSKSKSIETDKAASSSVDLDHGALEDMQYKGLRLLHLLTACAEAMSQEAQDLVEVILCRLRELVSPTGSTMERVAYYLFDALLHSNVNSFAHLGPSDKITKEHFLGALELLHMAYPYIRIPHFTANECILEAVVASGGANVGIHIIDFDIMEGTQWPPLMDALRNNRKYDVGHLRITAIKWAEDEDEDEDECLLHSGHTGRRLTEYAVSVGIQFWFQETDLEGLKEVLLQEGEIVILNCIWQLPHMINLRNKSQLLKFLVNARHLNPAAVTLATGPHGAEGHTADFLDSFVRRLEELCTIFDSLEAGLPEHELARVMVERIFFGPAMSRRVMNSTSGNHGQGHITESSVVDLPLKCGYGEGGISNTNIMFAKCNLLYSGVGRSYEVELVGHHRLVLKWASTPLVWVSTWKSP